MNNKKDSGIFQLDNGYWGCFVNITCYSHKYLTFNKLRLFSFSPLCYPLLSLHSNLVKKLGENIIGNILVFQFFVSLLLYLIGIFTGPLVQLVLMIIAIIHKKWRLVVIHMISAIALCGGIALLYKIIETIAYAN